MSNVEMTRQLSTAENVIEAVAEAEGIPAEHLIPPLYNAIDPDALNKLFGETSAHQRDLQVRFVYHGYQITVDGDQSVSIAKQKL